MSAEFNATLPTNKDHARALLGDVTANGETGTVDDPLLQDQTINAKLTSEGWANGLANLADMCLGIISKEPTRYSESLGILIDFTDRVPILRRLSSAASAGEVPEPGSAPIVSTSRTSSIENTPTW